MLVGSSESASTPKLVDDCSASEKSPNMKHGGLSRLQVGESPYQISTWATRIVSASCNSEKLLRFSVKSSNSIQSKDTAR